MDRSRYLEAVPSYGSPEQSIVNQVSHYSRRRLDGVQIARAESRWSSPDRGGLSFLDKHVEELHAGNNAADLVQKVKRHGDHRVGRLAQFFIKRGAMTLILVDLVLNESVFAGHDQADDAFTQRVPEPNDLFGI